MSSISNICENYNTILFNLNLSCFFLVSYLIGLLKTFEVLVIFYEQALFY